MEGAAFMLDKIKKMPEINASSVNKFDGKFDLDPDAMNLCSNCRFDIELNEQGNNIKYEFKSWGSVAINKIGTLSGASFTNQFKAYLADATDISKIQYIFDANKFSDVNAIKARFKVMFESDPQGMFAIMTPELKNSLGLNGLNAQNNYLQLIFDLNSDLYKFIKF
jgi:hypothetical protein